MSSRHLPLSVRMAILTFGIVRQFGWCFTAGSLAFCTIFLRHTDLRLRGYDAVTDGVVVNVERTSSSENEESIYAVDVEYRAGESPETMQQLREVRSYTTAPPEVGENVSVNYEAANPDEARMRGARTRRFGLWSVALLFIPLVGFLFAMHRVNESVRIIRLLRRGRQTTARLVGKHKEKDEDGETETTVRLQFTDEEGVERTFEVHTFAPEPLEDDPREVVFHDPHRPTLATALDHLPGKLELRGDTFVARARVWHLLISPMLTALAIAALIAARVYS